MIRCQGLRWGAPGQPLTPAVDFNLAAGSLTAVIGANGTGKSSLLKVLAGLQKPLAGKVHLDVPRRGGLSSFLPQQQHLDRQFPISLQELVAAGLWGIKQTPQQRNERLQAVIADWDLEGLEQRPLMALSGGQLQRALLARLSLADPTPLSTKKARHCCGNISTPGMRPVGPWWWSAMTSPRYACTSPMPCGSRTVAVSWRRATN